MTVFKQPYRPDAILKIGRRRKWQIVLPTLVITAAASWWIHRLPDRYRSDALLLVVPQRVPEAFVRPTVTMRPDLRLQATIQQMLSRTQLERIIRDFDLYSDRRRTDAMQDVVDSMRARDLEIRPVKGDAFRLGFSADSPDVAKRVVERLVSLLIVETSLDRATLAEGTDQFLEAQLEDARRRLMDNEAKLEEYRHRHNGELPSQLEANVRGVHNTEMQLQALTDSVNRDRDRQLMLDRSLKDARLGDLVDARAAVAPADPSRLSASEQLARAQATLEDMRSTLTEQHPDVVSLKQRIAELRQRSQQEDGLAGLAAGRAADVFRQSREEGLRAELAAVEQQIAQKVAEGERLRRVLLNYQRRLDAAPMREAELAGLTRDYDTLQQTYRGLLAKKQESAIAANLERQQSDAHFKVLDPARLPEQPYAPRRARLYAIAALGGFAIGLMWAVTLECLDRGLRTREAVQAALGLPVLAAIPLVPPRRRTATVVSIGTAIIACVAALAWRLLK